MPVKIKSFLPSVIWFIFITTLFVLPGSDLPDEDWFHKVYLDKWVHTGFFFLLVYLIQTPLLIRGISEIKKWLMLILFLAIFYGVAIEFIQKWWVPGRSFDILDMAFDSVGAIAAYMMAINKCKTL